MATSRTRFGGYSFSPFPYGFLETMVPLVLGIIAVLFSSIAIYGCSFAQRGQFPFQIGFWHARVAEHETCQAFSIAGENKNNGGIIHLGRAMSIILGALSYLCYAVIGASVFFALPKYVKGLTLVAIAAIILLTLLIFAVAFAPNGLCGDCAAGPGAILNSFALFLWIGTAISFNKLTTKAARATTTTATANAEEEEEEKEEGSTVEFAEPKTSLPKIT